MKLRATLGGLGYCAWLMGCGSTAPEAAAEPEQTQGDEHSDVGAADDVQVSGLLGTIPARKIDRALRNRLRVFQRCFFDGMEQVEFLGGRMEFMFWVGADGSPTRVHPKDSTIGHRATEQCLLARAAETRFPRPAGGDSAEFAWGFELDPMDGVRPPVAWSAEDIGPALPVLGEVAGACQASGVVATVYVQAGGQPLSVGASSNEPLDDNVLDCVVEGIQGQTLPDPGSYPAKVTFSLP